MAMKNTMERNAIEIYKNGTIITMDEKCPVASAMVIRDGIIVDRGPEDVIMSGAAAWIACKDGRSPDTPENGRVGGNQEPDGNTGNRGTGEARGAASDGAVGAINAQVVDLGGRVVLPGFIDAHIHLGACIVFKTQLDLSKVRSVAGLESTIRKWEAENLEPGDVDPWILGFDLMEDLFEDPIERVFPGRDILDRCCSGRPLVVLRHDGHLCGANSAVLERIGLTGDRVADIAAEVAGEIKIDASGEPTGIFTEEATRLVLDHVPVPPLNRLVEAGRDLSVELASHGITAFGAVMQLDENGILGKAGAMELPLLEMLLRDGAILQDIVFYAITGKPRKLARLRKRISSLAGGIPHRFDVGGVKVYADGSFGARTACMHDPYSDGEPGQAGFMVIEKEELQDLAREAQERGFQVACHTIGDKAHDVVVEAFESVMKGVEDHPGHRIEHVSIARKETIKKAADLGLILVVQPAFINSEHEWLERRLGPRRLQDTYAFKTMFDAGAVVAGASDAPIESPDVFQAVQACITRKGMVPEQAIKVEEALKMFTLNAARALRQEDVRGSISPGKLADFIIVDRNPLEVPVDEIQDIRVLETFKRGARIFHCR